MNAEILRRAAALMRSRAEAATWTSSPWGVDEIGAVWAQEADGQPVPVASRATDQDAEHIASWHPTVALAVADWLDTAANSADAALSVAQHILDPEYEACDCIGHIEWRASLVVARAYLNEDPA